MEFQVQVPNQCVRCGWKFITYAPFGDAKEEEKYCPTCTNDPLFDPDEEMLLKNAPVYEFMGWKFRERLVEPSNEAFPKIYLLCYKRLFNPEFPGADRSQSNFSLGDFDHNLYQSMPERQIKAHKKMCAAWLISHWWEHYLEICPCLNGERDDDEGGNFRKTVIEALLWYDEIL